MLAPSDTAPKSLRAGVSAAPLSGTITVPGDRSIGLRALLLGALATGTTAITGLPESEDVLRMAAAIGALGAKVEPLGGGAWRVAGRGIGGLVEPADVLDMGGSGAAARLLCGVLAGHPVFAVITGDAALRQRSMRQVTEALAATGARFTTRSGSRLPLAVEGMAEPLPLDYALPLPFSRAKSACLMAGLCARGTTRVREVEAAPDHTENLLRHFGATLRVAIEGKGRVIELDGQPELIAAPVAVPGDPSRAIFPALAALLVPGSAITIRNVGINPLRARLFLTLREMGADIIEQNQRLEAGERVADLVIRASTLAGRDVLAERVPSMLGEFPALAVAAACARGTTRLRGLRLRDSEGLAAIAALLAANGIHHEVEGDDLLIHGTGAPPEGGGLVRTRGNARIAMSALVLGLVARRPVRIDDGGCIEAGFPGFAALINGLGGGAADAPGPIKAGPIKQGSA